MPIEPSELRAVAATEVVVSDRPCTKCGYNVRGLRVGTRCPECGTVIGSARRRLNKYADNLTESPLWYLVVVLSGAVAMAIALVGSVGFSIYLGAQSASFRPLPLAVIAVGSLVFAGVWVVGVVLVTFKRPETEHTLPDAVLDSDALRWVSRVGQIVFVGAVVMRYAATTSGSGAVDTAATVLEYVSLFALAPLCVYLGSLSDWAGDTGGGERLRNAAWAFVVAGGGALLLGLLLMTAVPFKILLMVGLVVCMMVVLLGMFLFVASVLMLANTTAWAVFNADQSRKRDTRIAERKHRQIEQDAETSARQEEIARLQQAAVDQEVLAEQVSAIDEQLNALSPAAAGRASRTGGSPAAGAASGGDTRPKRSRSERVIEPGDTGGYALEPDDG
ncbi:MAG: hypothetical protein AAF297_00915 [Planctomycetota bacterium]